LFSSLLNSDGLGREEMSNFKKTSHSNTPMADALPIYYKRRISIKESYSKIISLEYGKMDKGSHVEKT
jgi:hypothetical protein